MIREYTSDLIKIAEKVAENAGGYLLKRLERSQIINFQDGRDVKLQADIDSEELIRRELRETTGLAVIGEEEGGDISLLDREDFFWVVDPLDGTYNYLRNQPETCVSIGLMQGKEFISGVIYDFNRAEMFSGGIKEGLSINGQKIKVHWPENIKKCCLMTGFPGKRNFSTASLERFISEVQRFKKVRMIGSAALALARVASGQADVYFEESICLWDIAAGVALVKAAGGYAEISRVKINNGFLFNCWASGRKEWLPKNPT